MALKYREFGPLEKQSGIESSQKRKEDPGAKVGASIQSKYIHGEKYSGMLPKNSSIGEKWIAIYLQQGRSPEGFTSAKKTLDHTGTFLVEMGGSR